MYKYKTKDGSEAFVPGHGHTVDGHITTDHPIENPNFELVSEPKSTASPEHVAGVVPQNAQGTPAVPQYQQPNTDNSVPLTPESEQ